MTDVFNAAYFNLDHRVILIAAWSSFLTLFVLSIVKKFNYIKYNYYDKKIIKYEEDIEQDNKMIPKKVPKEHVSKSLISTLCSNMIIDQYYIQMKENNYFETNKYLDLIPKNNKNWIYSKINLLVKNPQKYSEYLHQLMLDNFDVKSFEPKTNKHLNEITNAMNTFNEWRRWKVTTDSNKGWKFRTKTKHGMSVYTHSLANSDLDIVKAEQVFPYPVPIIVGTLMNIHHVSKMDDVLMKMDILEQCSISSTKLYLQIKMPFLLTNRDFMNIACIYIFKDGSILMGNTSVNEKNDVYKSKNGGTFIRATITLSMYHIRPDYDNNRQHSVVTFYSHSLLNGSIPAWILNIAYMQIADTLTKLQKYIKSNIKNYHKPGQLCIPPYPYLRMMNIIQ